MHVLVAILALALATPSAAFAKKKPPAHPINLNTAGATELQQVPGIGPSTAQKILDTRKSYGAFKSVDDLLSIKGIGKKRLEKMRKYLTVSKSAAAKTAPRSAVSASSPKKTDTPASVSPAAEAEEPPN